MFWFQVISNYISDVTMATPKKLSYYGLSLSRKKEVAVLEPMTLHQQQGNNAGSYLTSMTEQTF